MVDKKIKKQKRPKTKKDPNAPKKGMTAFLHFVQDRTTKYKEEHPALAHKEVIAKLGELWRGLPVKEKEPYEEKAKKEKEEYAKNVKEY